MAPSYKETSLEQRKRALGLLLSQSKDGVLPWGSLTIVADEIGVASSTISRLWWQAHGAVRMLRLSVRKKVVGARVAKILVKINEIMM